MLIQGKAQQQAPGLLADLLQWIRKVEPDEEKRDIRRITDVEQQVILQKKERIPQRTKTGTEKGYYVFIEDDDDIYLETKDEQGETVLVLNTEMNQQLVPDLITEKDTDKYFVQPDEQEDKDETETISSTSTADYDREEVEMSLQAIADAFHKIRNKYKHLCSIAPHMLKVQTANIIANHAICRKRILC